ncbi:hypothetical protein TeGR_g9839 [Tetraparma gracilis]|uniref:F-box domain-containing protein n=1 Tax=Tetraparma gracilis TaxID=2962635 RepID=A0ABQ6MAY0_9STRA|nr:hypothetical protein TeGR_g9839 [Tetraparma gracilis]
MDREAKRARTSPEEGQVVGPALNRLPLDALAIICTYLSPPQKLSVSMSCKALYSDFGRAEHDDRLWRITLPTGKRSDEFFNHRLDESARYDPLELPITSAGPWSISLVRCNTPDKKFALFTPNMARRTCVIQTGENKGTPITSYEEAWEYGQEGKDAWDLGFVQRLLIFEDASVSHDQTLDVRYLTLPCNYSTHRSFALCAWAIAAALLWQDTTAPAAALLDHAPAEALLCTRHFRRGSDFDARESSCAKAMKMLQRTLDGSVAWARVPTGTCPSVHGGGGSMVVKDPSIAEMIFQAAEGEASNDSQEQQMGSWVGGPGGTWEGRVWADELEEEEHEFNYGGLTFCPNKQRVRNFLRTKLYS